MAIEQVKSTAAPSEPGRPAGRRERRRRETRDRLYMAAIELFLKQGFEQTTMDDISDRADVARTTVFNYFPRKNDFLQEWGARRRDYVANQLREDRLHDKPIAVVLERYMGLLAQLCIDTTVETHALMPIAVASTIAFDHPPLADTLANYVRRGQRRGQVRADIDPYQVGLILTATYFTTVRVWCTEESPTIELRAALTGSARMLLDGISASLAS